MDVVLNRLFDLLGENTVGVSVVIVAMIAILMGPQYITAISQARSRRRRDNAELFEAEKRLAEQARKRLEGSEK